MCCLLYLNMFYWYILYVILLSLKEGATTFEHTLEQFQDRLRSDLGSYEVPGSLMILDLRKFGIVFKGDHVRSLRTGQI